ncbi:MAG: NAD(P)H-dependent oxidoreductase [Dehalococcoidia bacterium]
MSSNSATSQGLQVLGIAGSLRQGSYNRALLQAAQELVPEGMGIGVFDLSPIPFYNYDVEQEGDPEPVTALKEAIGAADAILIATPEYQRGIPGVLKNALDWAARPPRQSVMRGKPAAIMGASPGFTGTARAQTQLRQTLEYNRTYALLQPEVLIGGAGDKFRDGRLVDEETRTRVRELLAALADWTRLLQQGVAART